MPLQPEFESLVSNARNGLCSGLGALLDSLYLYGSVSRGNARPGQSDLDLTVVLTRPPSREESNALECIRLDLQARHPEVSKVDFDLGVREDVLNPANLHSWGYWIKHECRCIHGTDLALQFPAFAPSRTIALAINGDYMRALGDYAQRIDDASEPGDRKRLQRGCPQADSRNECAARCGRQLLAPHAGGTCRQLWPPPSRHGGRDRILPGRVRSAEHLQQALQRQAAAFRQLDAANPASRQRAVHTVQRSFSTMRLSVGTRLRI